MASHSKKPNDVGVGLSIADVCHLDTRTRRASTRASFRWSMRREKIREKPWEMTPLLCARVCATGARPPVAACHARPPALDRRAAWGSAQRVSLPLGGLGRLRRAAGAGRSPWGCRHRARGERLGRSWEAWRGPWTPRHTTQSLDCQEALCFQRVVCILPRCSVYLRRSGTPCMSIGWPYTPTPLLAGWPWAVYTRRVATPRAAGAASRRRAGRRGRWGREYLVYRSRSGLVTLLGWPIPSFTRTTRRCA